MINYNLKIDILDEKTLSSDITFVTGDVGAYKMTFEFFENQSVIDISNYLLTIKARRADGKCIAGSGNVLDNKAVFVPKSSLYAIPGEVVIEVALVDSAKNYITTKIITAEVIKGIGDEAVGQENEASVFVTLMSQVQSKIEEVKQLTQDAIPKKGVDYFTEEEKAEMVESVLDAIPDCDEVSY